MQKLFTEALKVRTLFGLAIFSLILVYLLKDTIHKFAGNEDILELLLAFLCFIILGVLGLTAYFAITEKEIEGEKGRPVARVDKSEDVEVNQSGSDGKVDVARSKGVTITQEGSSSNSGKKKHPTNK